MAEYAAVFLGTFVLFCIIGFVFSKIVFRPGRQKKYYRFSGHDGEMFLADQENSFNSELLKSDREEHAARVYSKKSEASY